MTARGLSGSCPTKLAKAKFARVKSAMAAPMLAAIAAAMMRA
jgi:hypothetical protein